MDAGALNLYKMAYFVRRQDILRNGFKTYNETEGRALVYRQKNLYGKRPKFHIHGRDKKKKNVVFVLFQIKEGK